MILYLVIQTLLNIFLYKKVLEVFNPNVALWYLLLLIYSLILLPYIQTAKNRPVLIISIIIGFLAGLEQIGILSITRFLVMFPFFLMGYYFKIEWINKYFKKKYVILSILIFILFFIFLYFLSNKNLESLLGLFYGKFSYNTLKIRTYKGIIYRMMHYILSYLLIIFLIILIPKNKNIFTSLGKNTLSVYLLHIPLVYIFKGTNNILTNGYDLYKLFCNPLGYLEVGLIAFIIVIVLSNKIFMKPFNKVFNMKFTWLFKKSVN